jgi:hypothetical protein
MKIIKVSLPSGSKMKQATQDGDTLVVEFEERFEPKDENNRRSKSGKLKRPYF